MRVGGYRGIGRFRDAADYYRADTSPAGQPAGSVTMSSVLLYYTEPGQRVRTTQDVIWGRSNLGAVTGAFWWAHRFAGGASFIDAVIIDSTVSPIRSTAYTLDDPALAVFRFGLHVLAFTYDGTTLRLYSPEGEIGAGVVSGGGITASTEVQNTTIGVRSLNVDRAVPGSVVLIQHSETNALSGVNMLAHLNGLIDDMANRRPFRALTGMGWEWNAEDAGVTWVDRVAGITLDRTGSPEPVHVAGRSV